MHSGLVNPIDFSREGRQAGHLAIPYSVDRSPYYQIRIPILRLKNGEGPSLLLMAGNHGDEYEGELQLGRLMRLIDLEKIRGAVTILPMANLPAVINKRVYALGPSSFRIDYYSGREMIDAVARNFR